jgi:hypothetical protein
VKRLGAISLTFLLGCGLPMTTVMSLIGDGTCIIGQTLAGNTDPASLLSKCAANVPNANEKLITEAIDRCGQQYQGQVLTPAQTQLMTTARATAVVALAARAAKH